MCILTNCGQGIPFLFTPSTVDTPLALHQHAQRSRAQRSRRVPVIANANTIGDPGTMMIKAQNLGAGADTLGQDNMDVKPFDIPGDMSFNDCQAKGCYRVSY